MIDQCCHDGICKVFPVIRRRVGIGDQMSSQSIGLVRLGVSYDSPLQPVFECETVYLRVRPIKNRIDCRENRSSTELWHLSGFLILPSRVSLVPLVLLAF